MEGNKALYFEAKAGSFSPESSNRKQALGTSWRQGRLSVKSTPR